MYVTRFEYVIFNDKWTFYENKNAYICYVMCDINWTKHNLCVTYHQRFKFYFLRIDKRDSKLEEQ